MKRIHNFLILWFFCSPYDVRDFCEILFAQMPSKIQMCFCEIAPRRFLFCVLTPSFFCFDFWVLELSCVGNYSLVSFSYRYLPNTPDTFLNHHAPCRKNDVCARS